MRVRAIDAFRGMAIVLMVFFSMTIRLSGSLPDFIVHNAPGSLHIGDFVLTMFLFASGMSLVHFHNKRAKSGRLNYALDAVERAGKLGMVWVFLSPFSSGMVFGMDELALSLVLSAATLLLIGLPDRLLAVACAVPPLAYITLAGAGVLPDFSAYYLGGFAAAPFYLPVMLAGVLAGRNTGAAWKIAVSGLIIGVALSFAFPPYKSIASPAFIAISIAVSAAAYMAVERLGLHWLEYPGKKPLEFWVLMFVFLIIPLVFNAVSMKSDLPLSLPWPLAVGISVACIPLLMGISMALEFLAMRVRPKKTGTKA